jgi:hypothetical protein
LSELLTVCSQLLPFLLPASARIARLWHVSPSDLRGLLALSVLRALGRTSRSGAMTWGSTGS